MELLARRSVSRSVAGDVSLVVTASSTSAPDHRAGWSRQGPISRGRIQRRGRTKAPRADQSGLRIYGRAASVIDQATSTGVAARRPTRTTRVADETKARRRNECELVKQQHRSQKPID